MTHENYESKEYIFYLEKRGRGRGLVGTLSGNPWTSRTFRLVNQTFNYYDNQDQLKGSINIINSHSYTIDMFDNSISAKPPSSSPLSSPSSSSSSFLIDKNIISNKKFPFILQLHDNNNNEKIYLNASSEYIRLKCINALNRSSINRHWNNDEDNEISENDIQMKLYGIIQQDDKVGGTYFIWLMII